MRIFADPEKGEFIEKRTWAQLLTGGVNDKDDANMGTITDGRRGPTLLG